MNTAQPIAAAAIMIAAITAATFMVQTSPGAAAGTLVVALLASLSIVGRKTQ